MINTVTIDLEYYHRLRDSAKTLSDIQNTNTYYIERNQWDGGHVIITNDQAIALMEKRIDQLDDRRRTLEDEAKKANKKLTFIEWLRS